MPAVLGNDPRKHRWGKENVKQEKGGGNSGCVDEQVTTAEDHRQAAHLLHLKDEEVVFIHQFSCITG